MKNKKYTVVSGIITDPNWKRVVKRSQKKVAGGGFIRLAVETARLGHDGAAWVAGRGLKVESVDYPGFVIISN